MGRGIYPHVNKLMCVTCRWYKDCKSIPQKLKTSCIWKIKFGPIRQGPEDNILFTRFALLVCLNLHLSFTRICVFKGKSEIDYFTIAPSQWSNEEPLLIESADKAFYLFSKLITHIYEIKHKLPWWCSTEPTSENPAGKLQIFSLSSTCFLQHISLLRDGEFLVHSRRSQSETYLLIILRFSSAIKRGFWKFEARSKNQEVIKSSGPSRPASSRWRSAPCRPRRRPRDPLPGAQRRWAGRWGRRSSGPLLF